MPPARPHQDASADAARLATIAITALAAIIDARPALLTAPNAPAITIDRGERTSLTAPAMLGQGLHLIAAPWAPAPAAPGWLAAMTTTRSARITGPDRQPHYDGTLAPPAGWRELAAAARQVELLTGIDGLDAIADGASLEESPRGRGRRRAPNRRHHPRQDHPPHPARLTTTSSPTPSPPPNGHPASPGKVPRNDAGAPTAANPHLMAPAPADRR